MCGRYTLSSPGDLVADLFDLDQVPEIPPRYNVAPTQEVAVVRREDDHRAFRWLRWGLVPFWADDPSIGNRMINARAETAAEKPAFRAAFKKRRCLVLADGFYEWQKVHGGAKQPWLFRLASGEPFAFAGLWESWRDDEAPEGEPPLETVTLLTTDANPVVAPVHHRMPVILGREDHNLWLDPAIADRERLEALLDPYVPEEMVAHPVSRRVNKPQNDDPSVVEPVDLPAEGGDGAAERGSDSPQQELF